MPGRGPGVLWWQGSSPGGARSSCGDGAGAVAVGWRWFGGRQGWVVWPGPRDAVALAGALPAGMLAASL